MSREYLPRSRNQNLGLRQGARNWRHAVVLNPEVLDPKLQLAKNVKPSGDNKSTLTDIFQKSVGQIFSKETGDCAQFICTGFIIAKAADTSGKQAKLRVLVMSCAHTHREICNKKELFFSLQKDIVETMPTKPIKLQPIQSSLAWLTSQREEDIDPFTQAVLNISDLQVYLGEVELRKQQETDLFEAIPFSGRYSAKDKMMVIGYSSRNQPEIEDPNYEDSRSQTESEESDEEELEQHQNYTEGKCYYECFDIKEGKNVIAAKFSGNPGMTGSPLLRENKLNKTWEVIGVYTQGTQGKMSSYLQYLSDHFEAGEPLAGVTLDFSSFDLLKEEAVQEDKQFEKCKSAFVKELHDLFFEGTVNYNFKLHDHLVFLEAKYTDWRNFNHNVVVKSGERFQEIKKIKALFEQSHGEATEQIPSYGQLLKKLFGVTEAPFSKKERMRKIRYKETGEINDVFSRHWIEPDWEKFGRELTALVHQSKCYYIKERETQGFNLMLQDVFGSVRKSKVVEKKVEKKQKEKEEKKRSKALKESQKKSRISKQRSDNK